MTTSKQAVIVHLRFCAFFFSRSINSPIRRCFSQDTSFACTAILVTVENDHLIAPTSPLSQRRKERCIRWCVYLFHRSELAARLCSVSCASCVSMAHGCKLRKVGPPSTVHLPEKGKRFLRVWARCSSTPTVDKPIGASPQHMFCSNNLLFHLQSWKN